MEVIDIFPLPLVWENLAGKFDEREAAEILAITGKEAEWTLNQGKNYLYPEWYVLDKHGPTLKKAIEDRLHWYVREVWGESEATMRITTSWVNYNPPKTKHHPHTHPNSVFSGCFYLEAAQQAGNFIVTNPNKKQFGSKVINQNKYSSPIFGFRQEKFDLVMFPSWLEHQVEQNKSNSTRVSLAFNTFYTGKLGTMEEATELIVG